MKSIFSKKVLLTLLALVGLLGGSATLGYLYPEQSEPLLAFVSSWFQNNSQIILGSSIGITVPILVAVFVKVVLLGKNPKQALDEAVGRSPVNAQPANTDEHKPEPVKVVVSKRELSLSEREKCASEAAELIVTIRDKRDGLAREEDRVPGQTQAIHEANTALRQAEVETEKRLRAFETALRAQRKTHDRVNTLASEIEQLEAKRDRLRKMAQSGIEETTVA